MMAPSRLPTWEAVEAEVAATAAGGVAEAMEASPHSAAAWADTPVPEWLPAAASTLAPELPVGPAALPTMATGTLGMGTTAITVTSSSMAATPIITETITATIINSDYYGGSCYWLRRQAVITGSRYWWARYESCLGYY